MLAGYELPIFWICPAQADDKDLMQRLGSWLFGTCLVPRLAGVLSCEWNRSFVAEAPPRAHNMRSPHKRTAGLCC